MLLAQCKDSEALESLLKSVQEPLFCYIASITGEHEIAADILQETFIRIYRKLTMLRSPEFFRAWAFRIASRETFRWLKHARKFYTLENAELDGHESVFYEIESSFERDEILKQLYDSISQLPPACKAVLALHYEQEVSLQEIADILEIPIGTVKSRLAYGLKKVRKTQRNDLTV